MGRPAALAHVPPLATPLRHCGVCQKAIFAGNGDNLAKSLCIDHDTQPGGRRIHLLSDRELSSPAANDAAPARRSRDFTVAEKSFIRRVHGFMASGQILTILNERMAAELGAKTVPYTIEQLHAQIGESLSLPDAGALDWASLRQVLAHAKSEGTLDLVTEQVIDDFAVVFSLSAGQVSRLKDILLRSEDA